MHRARTILTVTCLLLYASAIIVPTPDGNILGVSTPFGYNVFRGIPYSENPQRWTHATPKQPWSYVLNATRFGSECPQSNNLFTDKSEDCLFLNVWSPSKINETLPVMVYIHGNIITS
jgi:para-nitrobenzyl esterase